MRIAIGSDHAGFEYKEMIKKHLGEGGHDVRDFGTDSNESVDYPEFVRPVAQAVASEEFERGIVERVQGRVQIVDEIHGAWVDKPVSEPLRVDVGVSHVGAKHRIVRHDQRLMRFQRLLGTKKKKIG